MRHPQATYALNHPITEYLQPLPPEYIMLVSDANLTVGISVDLNLDGPHTQPMWHVSVAYWDMYKGRLPVINWPSHILKRVESIRDSIMYGCGDGDWEDAPDPEAHPRSVQWYKRLTSDEVAKMGREI